ncbi:hypothetical protein T265_08109 [Opisthorchis viverrini]|uniref:Uncharacterized protein n=1 Tax=Opisthorchis viverrini TaxID=6198 RepID=A0A074ZEX5_OPIVI|nr:hypothetical protein T265_08109 [Opisthorchis viverrini]KER24172.1 hypothetical protein T265_08109 [Opisthorchis viverrini]
MHTILDGAAVGADYDTQLDEFEGVVQSAQHRNGYAVVFTEVAGASGQHDLFATAVAAAAVADAPPLA